MLCQNEDHFKTPLIAEYRLNLLQNRSGAQCRQHTCIIEVRWPLPCEASTSHSIAISSADEESQEESRSDVHRKSQCS